MSPLISSVSARSAQRGGAAVVLLALTGALVAVAIVVIASYITAFNSGNAMEAALRAQQDNNRNIYASYTQKVMEAAQVPAMMRDDMSRVVRDALEARYGEQGSRAVLQMITEQNPNLDPELYRKVQQIIESGRDEFKTAQTRLIDVKRSYETSLGSFWTGMWLRIAGYPKIDLAQFVPVTTARTESVFQNKREDAPLELRPAQPAAPTVAPAPTAPVSPAAK